MLIDAMTALRKLMAVYNVQVTPVKPPFAELKQFDLGLRAGLAPGFDWQKFGEDLLSDIRPGTLTYGEDSFQMVYAVFCPPGEESNGEGCIIGPWQREVKTAEQLFWTEKELGSQTAAIVREYCSNIPSAGVEFEQVILTAVGMMFPEGELKAVYENHYLPFYFRPDQKYFNEPMARQEISFVMLEQRYRTENQLLDAVAAGDEETAEKISQQMNRYNYGGRFQGDVMAVRHKLIILNTLFRKSIEHCGIHPYYIDEISARFAVRIQNMTLEEDRELIQEMIREYCAYVTKYSLENYSSVVQNAIHQICFHLNGTLSLKRLAELCHISPNCLSNLFKQETGVTVTDYINTQRIQLAAKRLCTSNISIADAAEEVGILDVNYFTKLFKKVFGITPTSYRKENASRKREKRADQNA